MPPVGHLLSPRTVEPKPNSSLGLTAHHNFRLARGCVVQHRNMKTLFLTLTLTTGLLAQAPFQAKVTGHGQPMILIPGLSSSGETWDTTVEHYKDRFECHVLTVAGFAGVPRVPVPMLDRVRDGIAEYIREKRLDHPVIVGHSLGGFLALSVAGKYPALAGKLVIVDAYPFLAGVIDPEATPDKAKAMAAQMKQYMGGQSQEDYERYVKSGVSSRAMVTSESNFNRIVAWGWPPTAVRSPTPCPKCTRRTCAKTSPKSKPRRWFWARGSPTSSTPTGHGRRPTCTSSMPNSPARKSKSTTPPATSSCGMIRIGCLV